MALTNESALSFLMPMFPFPSRHNTTLKAQRCFSLNILKALRTVKSAHETLLALFVLHSTEKAAERKDELSILWALCSRWIGRWTAPLDNGTDELNVTVFGPDRNTQPFPVPATGQLCGSWKRIDLNVLCKSNGTLKIPSYYF